jgi:hypothetical protein
MTRRIFADEDRTFIFAFTTLYVWAGGITISAGGITRTTGGITETTGGITGSL